MESVAEEWRAVGLDGNYEVSNLGRVRSLDRTLTYKNGHSYRWKGQVLSPRLGGNGYFNVKVGKHVGIYVHRLVAEAFIRPMAPGEVVNHIDGSKTNNISTNLEIISQRENTSHACRTGLLDNRGSNHVLATATEKQIRSAMELVEQGHPICKAAEAVGLTKNQLYKIRQGRRWKHLSI